MKRAAVTIVTGSGPMAAAADAARQGLPATGAPIGSVLLSLVLVIALIVALAWALRRLQSGRAGGSRFMHVIAQVPLGPRERVVLVRVGEYQALLGVSPGGVTSLRLLDVEVSTTAPPPAQAGSDATALLARMRDLIERSRGR